MKNLSARERLKRSIEHKEVDRPPIFDKLRNNRIIEHYAERPLGIGDRETVCVAAGQCLDCICNVRGPAEPSVQTTPDGLRIETQKWTTWHERRIKDETQLVRHLEACLQSRSDPSAVRKHAEAHMEGHRQLQSWCGETCLVALNAPAVGIDGLIQLGGLELFSYLIADGSGLDDAYLEWCTNNAIEFGKALAPIADTFFVHTGEDIAFKTGTLASPAYLREKFFPRMKCVCDFWHEAGFYVQFHSDGNLREILDDFIAAGVDALHPMEKLAGMDIIELARQYGSRMTFCGGVDVSQLLPFGSPDEVAEEVRRIIAATAGTGLWIGSTTEVNDEVPLENYQALVDTVRGQSPLLDKEGI